ncbi:MAG: tRNA 2-thiocytidine biosynthesis TtcA family protein [Treponema sp.]|nr:tRNA 2-thiocytidine biosynthesis TtcA family protein [Treponema sp.]
MQPKIFSLIDKAIYDYDMIPNGAKILVGASGGKDSTLLIEYFANRMKRRNESFSFTALYIKTDFADEFSPQLKKTFDDWGVKLEVLEVNTLERVKPGRKMNCFWCSMQRRMELNEYAAREGFSHVALGHHLDDALETLLMNMLNKGTLETMPPAMKYDKFPVTIIRPLYYTPVSAIISHAQEMGWKSLTCTCNYQDNSGRKDVRKRLEVLTNGDDGQKKRMLLALKNIRPAYLP